MMGTRTSIALAFVAAGFWIAALRLEAQSGPATVEAGVYSDVQATRGAAAYDTACARCHRQDLTGADGPALKDDRFNRNFAGKDLKTLFERVVSMPRGAPGSLADNVYIDILAHLLRENGFPAGPSELTSARLEGVQVLPTRPKPLPPPGDFSYVDVVGCFGAAADGTWQLTHASAPASAAAPGTPEAAKRTVSELGAETYRLPDAMAYKPESRQGDKTYLRGFLVRLPDEQRIVISQIEALGKCE